MPVCNKCGVEKEQDQFPKDKKSKTGYSYHCKKCNCEKAKKYVEEYPEWNEVYQQKYRDSHKQKIREYNQIYIKENKDVLQTAHRVYRKKNAEVIALQKKVYYEENKDQIKVYKQEWARKNDEYLVEKRHIDYMKNREYRLRQSAIYVKQRRQTDIEFRILTNLRRRVTYALQNAIKVDCTLNLIGCSLPELKLWLESQFQEGMNWENYGVYGWHIDHCRPCASFDLTDPEQQRQCFNYKNLQPLWAKDNLQKSDKWEAVLEA